MKTLALFDRTGVCRLFESFNMAQSTFGAQFLYTRPSDLSRLKDPMLTLDRVRDWAASRSQPIPPILTKDVLEALWDTAVLVSDRVKGTLSEPKPRTKAGYFVNLAHEAPPPATVKQCRCIAAALKEARYDFYTKEEMQRFCWSPIFLKHVRTKQDPWRIFRYYRNDLIALNVISYEGGSEPDE